MILRDWSATATPEGARKYARHFSTAVLPRLRALPGFRTAFLLTRTDAGLVRIRVLTVWECFDAVRALAGPDPSVAAVEPAARSAVLDYDRTVTHFEIADLPSAASDALP
ncbi:hypothetical protein DMB38_31270 [Streptomyces sp. WAC 06738]|uniref:hypothetical protein n=1 Tax=Streptomyces sp. WAC 06738 TaxID=2203210 RepID=UPI000F6D0DB3|nr:hypothetical protein [Streptomyces sp. WAC 06738]AZM49660.1 hypothetical protein DMB38_31270 [Streptomyces sp. WAC 06738]